LLPEYSDSKHKGISEQTTAECNTLPQSEKSSMQLTFGDAQDLGKRKQPRR